MTAPEPGRLTNPEAWQKVLPTELFEALVAWMRSQPFDVAHRRWFGEGSSGSHVAGVILHPRRGAVRGSILKLLPPEIASKETLGVELAMDYSPAEFAAAHIAPTTSSGRLGGTGWHLHLQDPAEVDAATLAPLADLVRDANFAEYCRIVAGSVVNDWKLEHDPPWLTRTAAGYLREHLTSHLRKNGGLREFARRAGLDLDHPDELMLVPGRPEHLPNPLALLRGNLGDELREAVIFLGNGHGDLHLDNILIPVEPGINPQRYVLVDLGRFSHTTQVSRDPMKLLLSIAQTWLPDLVPERGIRSNLAELTVRPRAFSASPQVAGYRTIAERIHEAGEEWAQRRKVTSEWTAQNQLVLVDAALRTVAQTSLSMADRWWYFEVAALATRALLDPKPTGAYTAPSPRMDAAADVVLNRGHSTVDSGATARRYRGTTKLHFCKNLGGSWPALADVLEIPDYDRAQWTQGDRARGIWSWLESRNRLDSLPQGLRSIDRPDLAQMLDHDADHPL